MFVISTDMTKEEIRQLLGQNTLRVIAVTDGVTEVYANLRPDTSGWSISEIIAHMSLSDKGVYMAMRRGKDKVMENKDITDDSIHEFLIDGSTKIKSLESFLPIANVKLADALYDFNYWRDAIFDYINKSNDTFESGYTPHPILGLLNRKQWLLFSLYHAERHIQQIIRVKAYLSQHN